MNQTQKTFFLTGMVVLTVTIFAMTNLPHKKHRMHEPVIKKKPDVFKKESLEGLKTSKNAFNFFENKGQIKVEGHDIRYMLEANGVKCYLKPDGIVYSFVKIKGQAKSNDKTSMNRQKNRIKMEVAPLLMQWKGSNADVNIKAEDHGLEVRNYYNADTPVGITDVKGYRKITYENIYRNINLIFYSQENELKYDFVVKPGGNVRDIRLVYAGNKSLDITKDGELWITGKLGTLEEGKPFTYQTKYGIEKEIDCRYRIDDGIVSFEIGDYDTDENVIIDPTLLWATYYGAQASDYGNAVCTDPLGNVYVAGSTYSATHIAFNGHDETLGYADAFLVKFDATGDRIWSTYYGGDKYDAGNAVCTDAYGNVFLAGTTRSHSGIAFDGHDNVYNDSGNTEGSHLDEDAFLAKFNEDGIRQWGTYYGGEDNRVDKGYGVSADNDGNIFFAGATNSTKGIASDGYDNIFSGNNNLRDGVLAIKGNDIEDNLDAFLVKFDNDGVRQWGTYYGNNPHDQAKAVCTDPWGNVYITGDTKSQYLGHNGHDISFGGGMGDAFLTKFSSSGDLYWSTYYGGSEYEMGFSVATDGYGSVYLAGTTESENAIAFNAHDPTYNGGLSDAFLVKFNFFGTRLWGTYYGGDDVDGANGVCVSKYGDIYLTGLSASSTGIATNNGYKTHNELGDAFLARFNSAGQRQWGTYFGGSYHDDSSLGVATDVSGNVYIVGRTESEGLSYNGFQGAINGEEEAFLAKFKPYESPEGPGDFKVERRSDTGNPDAVHSISASGRIAAEDNANFDMLEFSVYPNPAMEEFRITSGNLSGLEANLQIFDIQGNVVFSRKLESGINQFIDVENWARGLYIVKLKTPFREVSQKVVLE